MTERQRRLTALLMGLAMGYAAATVVWVLTGYGDEDLTAMVIKLSELDEEKAQSSAEIEKLKRRGRACDLTLQGDALVLKDARIRLDLCRQRVRDYTTLRIMCGEMAKRLEAGAM